MIALALSVVRLNFVALQGIFDRVLRQCASIYLLLGEIADDWR